ncbi:type II 3-dehydroquinate dehydratase [Paraconexibacter sp.]|uniref:type II 3-dehydroquinate dehydratase n=1 Tax=Paraconexibacter sp. TaxID=2949640 RepID=UPI00356260F0
MSSVRNRIEVMHGVNLDQLGRRSPAHYGTASFDELQFKVDGFGEELDLSLRFFQTNHEGDFVERLHELDGTVDGIVLNPGAWTHYSYAIRDALELAALPAVEVHLSDIHKREEFRRHSVISDLCLATISGQGIDGYREALVRLRAELGA